MEGAYVEFVSQWKAYLLGHQLRDETPVLQDLLDEYDYIVAYVDSIYEGFASHVAILGLGSFSGLIHNVRPEGLIGVDLMDVVEQPVGQSSSENPEETPEATIARVEEIVDLTLD